MRGSSQSRGFAGEGDEIVLEERERDATTIAECRIPEGVKPIR
jgi:hypothetical protein